MTSKDDKQDSEEEVDVDELLDTIDLPQETFLASLEILKDSVHRFLLIHYFDNHVLQNKLFI